MNMERRYRRRQPAEFDVAVRYRGRRLREARARDLSAEGIFITISGITLPIGTQLELEFQLDGQDWFPSAVVVHSMKGGAGLMFREPQYQLAADEATPPSLPSTVVGELP